MLKEISFIEGNSFDNVKKILRNAVSNSDKLVISSEWKHVFLYYIVLKQKGFLNELIDYSLFSEFEEKIKDRLPELSQVNKYFFEIIGTHPLSFNSLNQLFFSLSSDVFAKHSAELFDDVLYELSKSAGPRSGEFVLPPEISRFACSLVDLSPDAKVYNPFAGYASFDVFLKGNFNYFGQEKNEKTWAIGFLRIIAHNKELNSKFDLGDSIENWNPGFKTYDLVISNPPFNLRLPGGGGYWGAQEDFRTVEYFIIQKGIEVLNENGKLILFVPTNFLAGNGRDNILKTHLVTQDLIEYVIAFPNDLLRNTGIPFSILVLNKNKKEKGIVQFVRASKFVTESKQESDKLNENELIAAIRAGSDNNLIRKISLETIMDQDYAINVGTYFHKNTSGIILSEFASVIRRARTTENQSGKFIRIRNLKADNFNYQLDLENIEVGEIPKSAISIHESCLLLATRWKTLKPTYFNFSETPIWITPDIIALKIDESKIDIGYLINELHSDNVREQVDSMRISAVIPYIRQNDLCRIKIELPSLAEQRATLKGIIDASRISKIKESSLENELEKFKKIQKDDLSIKKHNIMQHLNNVKASADSLLNRMNENNGVLEAGAVINPKRGTLVIDSFLRMIDSINESLYFVDNLTNELEFDKKGIFNLEEIINESIEKGFSNPKLFSIDLYIDKNSFQWGELSEESIAPFVEISKKDFIELYNNLLENAINHGFIDKTKHYTFLISLEGDLGSGIVKISFSNNGKAFPKGMAERFCLKGEKAGKTGNTGLGTWKVCEIAKYFGGKIIPNDLSEEQFPVKIDLIIPLKNMIEE